MDEVLQRRLVGAGVLLAGAFLVSMLLPDAGPRSGRSSDHVVTYDLRTGQPLDLPPPPAAAATAKPSEPATVTPTPTSAPAPDVAPARTIVAAEPKPAEPKAASAKPAEPSAKPAKPATLSHPVLKVDESFGQKKPPVPPSAQWFVQIGSFESQANARSVLKKLYDAGMPALIQTVPSGSKLWYRVRVGPYASENAATQVLGTLRSHGYKQAKLVKPDSGPAKGGN